MPGTIGKLAAATAPVGETRRDDERARITGAPGAALRAKQYQSVRIVDGHVTGGAP